MAKKKKIDRKSRLYQLPARRGPQKGLFSSTKSAGVSTFRFIGARANVFAAVRNNWNLRGFILTCFFLSGLASLIYQVLWVRQLGLIFGTTLQAVSTVLAVFMAGLALGSFLFGRIADRTKSPMRLFAYLEVGIGVYVMLIPLIFMALNAIQVSIYAALPTGSSAITWLRILGCFIVLIVPATLMGGTLPVIARFFVRRKEELGGGVGNLYFINTLGAVFGAFLAGFVLIPTIGVLASTFLAASIDLAVGVIFYLLDRYKLKQIQESTPVEEPVPIDQAPLEVEPPAQQLSKKQLKRSEREQRKLERTKPQGYSKAMRMAVFIGFALGGLASLSLEISWTRVLSMVLGSSVYAFSLMLIAFLLGIAAGSAIAARFVDRSNRLWVYFFVVEALIGIAVVVLNPLLGQLPLMFVPVFHNVAASFWLLQFVLFLLLLLIMLVPTLLMGAAFPIAAKIYTEDMDHMGASVGRLYAGNTFGSMVGPLLTGFVIIPLIGIQWSVSLVAAIYLVIAGAVFIIGFKSHLRVPDMSPLWRFLSTYARPKRILTAITMLPLFVIWVLVHPVHSTVALGKGVSRISVGLAGAVVLTVFVINILIPVWGSWNRKVVTSGVFLYSDQYYQNLDNLSEELNRNTHLLYYDEGLLSTVAVYDTADGNRTLRIDGKDDASTFSDLSTELMLGHLPMLLHDDPEQVLLIGLGSGITLGAVELHPELVNVEAVEIEGAVIEAAELFSTANGDALNNEKLDMIQADARNYVLAQTKKDKKYDVITAEPSNPWMAGNSIMFTREQFELYSSVLEDDGIICQWIHYYNMGEDDLKTVFRTFSSVFDDTTLWRRPDVGDLLLIGSKSPQQVDFAALNGRMQQAEVSDDLARVDMDDIYNVLGMFVMGPEALADYCKGAPMHTDDHPILQFSAPQNLYSETSTQDNDQSLQAAAENIEDIDSFLLNTDVDADFSANIEAQRDFMSHFAQANVHRRNERNSDAVESYERALASGVNTALGYRFLGTFYWSIGQTQDAVDNWKEAAVLNPSDAWTWARMGASSLSLGAYSEALNAYDNAVDLVPQNAFLHLRRGQTYQALEEYEEAVSNYDEGIRLYPASDDVYTYRALAYLELALAADDLQQKEAYLAQALSDVNDALARNSRRALAYDIRGQVYYERGRQEEATAASRTLYNQAIAEYNKSISIDGKLYTAHLHLGKAYAALGGQNSVYEAYQSMNRAVTINRSYAECWYEMGLFAPTLAQYEDFAQINWIRAAVDHFSEAYDVDPAADIAQDALAGVDDLFDWDNIKEADRDNIEFVIEKLPGTYVASKAQNAINAL
ncbi:fused MFS/spermidine synthase [Chloroflexota bacterium]